MNEIFKVPQHTGERGRPKGVSVLGSKPKEQGEPEILGAKVPGEPKVIDKNTKTDE